jgi:hypothetical protein
MKTTEVNIARFEEALGWILTHPDEWDQNVFSETIVDAEGNVCKTTYCLAGAVCMLNKRMVWITAEKQFAALHSNGSYSQEWTGVAQELLGISASLANEIFYNFGDTEDQWMSRVWSSPEAYVDFVRAEVRRETGVEINVPM